MFNLENANYHIHTYYSDGEYSPSYVVSKFAGLGCTELAITDHDGVEGIPEGMMKARELGVILHTGIEFSTRTEDGIGMHILGYDIDIENERLLSRLDDIRSWRMERNERMISELCDMGMPLTLEELTVREGQTFLGKPIFARVMVEKGYIEKFDDAFGDRVFGSERLKAIKKKTITPEEAIELILQAGGIPVIAHPGLLKKMGGNRDTEEFYTGFEKLVDRLTAHGLKGIECIYDNKKEEKRHTDREKARFSEIAEARGLYITKGTDFHNER